MERFSSQRPAAEVVCTNIRKLAIAKGLSNKELCLRAKLSGSYSTLLSHPDRFNPTVDVLEKIAGVLKCSMEDLFKDKLDVDEFGTMPPDMKEYRLVLTDLQRFTLEETLKYNERRIEQYRARRKARYDELQKF